MARPVILSNGEMLVGLDRFGMVHDFYYPYIGQENHASARLMHHWVGVWVDGQFSWLDDGNWDIKLCYVDGTLVGSMVAHNPKLSITLTTHDFIDAEDSVFARQISIHNNSEKTRDVRLFLHQAFQISDSNRGGTAQYHPNDHMVVHYKGRRAFAIYAESENKPFDQFSVGLFGIEGKEGTYRDAEDGELAGNAVEHGRVDSVLRISMKLAADASQDATYWIAAARQPDAAITLSKEFRATGLLKRRAATEQSWHDWVKPATSRLNVIPEDKRAAAVKSLLILKSHIDQRGGVLASADSDMLNYGRDYYGYCWPRDAVNVIWPLLKLGYTEEAVNFFTFCGRVQHKDGYLMHKYQLDGALGSSWHPYISNGKPELPIQEDETAAVVLLVDRYNQDTEDDDRIREAYGALVRPAATFMTSYIDEETGLPHASYDLWEERFGTHTYTVAVTFAALEAASRLAQQYGTAKEARLWQRTADGIKASAQDRLWNEEQSYLYRGLLLTNDGMQLDTVVDIASLYGAVTFGLFELSDPRMVRALETATKRLSITTPTGKAVVRYENDWYYRADPNSIGNPWVIATLWLAKLHHAAGNAKLADELLNWALTIIATTGVLPEQVNPDTNECVSVTPLAWSQAELVDTLLSLAPNQ